MILPEGFQFSQKSLQDFVDCRRRFFYRYVWRVAWPSVVSSPANEHERMMETGRLFHKLVYQYWVGVPAHELEKTIHDSEVLGWWHAFCLYAKSLSEQFQANLFKAEFPISAPFGDYRLAAKYDLVYASNDGDFVILDWKTHSKLPKRIWLADRLQTRVYRYLFVVAGGFMSRDKQIIPDKLSMVYWYAGFPNRPLLFEYSKKQFAEDRIYFHNLLTKITNLDEEGFTMAPDERTCQYCVYRSLCDRGIEAGIFDGENLDVEADIEELMDFDIDQIAEIEF